MVPGVSSGDRRNCELKASRCDRQHNILRALCMFCEENFGKINAKDVDKFFRNGYVHEFYRLKAFITLLGSLVECGKLSLYAYESRDEHDR